MLCVGCGGDPLGNWQSRQELPNGKRTEMFVEEGGGGDLEMYVQITTQGGVVRVDYDILDWFVEADGAYEFQLGCTKGCDQPGVNVSLDFEMDCEYDSGNEWLDCEAKSPWQNYGFFEFELEP